MNNREIKFRRYHFDFDGKCYHVSEWGFINGAFASPSSLSNEDRSKAIDCQSTGRVDKTHDEVYEGHIIRKTTYPFTKFEVKFENASFTVSKYPSAGIKIIGNIHQNPELL